MTPLKKEFLHKLAVDGELQVKDGILKPIHLWAIREEYVYTRILQDIPRDVPYIFRPRMYYLFPTNKCLDLEKMK